MDKDNPNVKSGSTAPYARPIPDCQKPGANHKVKPNLTKPAAIRLPVMELGDAVEAALKNVGITKDRVSAWLGRPCRCSERQEILNRLSRWARRILSGQTEEAEKYLNELMEEPTNTSNTIEGIP